MALIAPITGFVKNPMTEDLQCSGQALNDIATFRTAVLLTNALDTIAGSLATQIDLDDSLNVAATKRIDFTGVGEIERGAGLGDHIRIVNLPTTGLPPTNVLAYNTVTNEIESSTAILAPFDWSTFPATVNPDINSFQINNLQNVTGTNIGFDFGGPATIQCLSATINVGASQIAVNTPFNEIRLQADDIFINGKIIGNNSPTLGFFLGNGLANQFLEWKDPANITVGFTTTFDNVNGAVADTIIVNTAIDTSVFLPARENCFLKFNQSTTPNRLEWELKTTTQFRQSKMFPTNVVENPYGNLDTGIPIFPSESYFECAVNHPNGYVYFLPYDTRHLTILNPEDATSSIYPSFSDPNPASYNCAITATNMKIYAPPYQTFDWFVYDPYTNTHATIAGISNGFVCVTQIGNFLYTLQTDGSTASDIVKLNLTTNVQTLITAGLVGSWWGCSIGVDGKIYYAPYASTDILVLDPTTDTTSTIPTGLALGTDMYKSVCMAKDGNLYFAPYNATAIMILNTRTSTVSFLGTFAGSNLYSGITASTNDKLYLCPYGADNIAIVDHVAGTVDTTTITGLNATFGTEKWSQMLLLQNATQMVLVPFRVTFGGGITEPSTRTVKSGQPTIPAWMLSQNLNKQ